MLYIILFVVVVCLLLSYVINKVEDVGAKISTKIYMEKRFRETRARALVSQKEALERTKVIVANHNEDMRRRAMEREKASEEERRRARLEQVIFRDNKY